MSQHHKHHLITQGISYLSGLLFGLGLIISQMVDPAKVLGFLDLFGNWDPSLALVMVAAVGIGLPIFWLAKKRVSTGKNAMNADTIQLPQKTQLTKPLIVGSLLFGAGWGLAGLCPGPAIVAAATGHTMVLIFIGAMIVGFYLFTWYDTIKTRTASRS